MTGNLHDMIDWDPFSMFANMWHLAAEELKRLEQSSGRDFDLYACAENDTVQDNACKQMCSAEDFLRSNVAGKHTLLHALAYGQVKGECIQHCLAYKAAAPGNTSACILVPRRVEEAIWRPLLRGMKRIAQCPVGAAIFADGACVEQEALAV
jgi:hypothetical protein